MKAVSAWEKYRKSAVSTWEKSGKAKKGGLAGSTLGEVSISKRQRLISPP